MNSFQDLWTQVMKKLENDLNHVTFEVWMSKLEAVSFENGVFTITAPSNFHSEMIMDNYYGLLKDTFMQAIGLDVEIEVVSAETWSPVKEEPIETLSDEVYTFSNFIVGSSNDFAYAASQAVAENPGQANNPLLIHGDSGLGKTHLLFAIIARYKEKFPNKRVVYTRGEEFTNEFITSLGLNQMNEFRKKYRSVDILLIDDIQFIAGKQSTQDEFFHTFNTLYQDNKQIILTSDRPPKEIKSLEDRLLSRFEWGLMADVRSPDFETRSAIIKRKADQIGLHLENDTVEYIATKVKTNIRQLEGIVKKLNAYHKLKGERITINSAHSAIRDILSDSQPIAITIDKIISEVARTYEVNSEDIKSKKRASQISSARQVAIYVVREITQMSLESIGEQFGGRDHSTIVYAISQVKKLMSKNQSYKSTIEDIIKNLKSQN